MKVIDLLNKIANGEEPPKRIFYKKQWWEYNPYNDYEGIEWGGCLLNNVLINELNDEITSYITEEDKEIEEIDVLFPCDKFNGDVDGFIFIYNHNLGAIKRKLGEIIKEVNELKRGKENE